MCRRLDTAVILTRSSFYFSKLTISNYFCFTFFPLQAELRPIDADSDRAEATQTDEDEMGMTYAELGVFGYLRKVMKCGPVKMFLRLVEMWRFLTPDEVGVKVSAMAF